MIQKLPIFFPPISNCYSTCSGVASILQAYDKYNPALFLNRLYLYRKSNNVLKFASIEKTNEITVINCDEDKVCDRLTEVLDNNIYAFLCLDHFYIKESSHFHSSHFMHDFTLVYGYDSDKKVFFCSDNFVGGKYLQKEVSFKETEDAWNSVLNSGSAQIILFHYDKLVYNNKLDFCKINLVLQDYVNSKFDNIVKLNPTFLSNNIFGLNNGQKCTYETCVFGIKIYEWLLDYLKNANRFDLRPLQLLINHQTILLYLIECIQRYKDVMYAPRYADLLNTQISDCVIARNLAIKYNLLQNPDIRKNFTDKMKQIYSIESLFFDAFLSDRQVWNIDYE